MMAEYETFLRMLDRAKVKYLDYTKVSGAKRHCPEASAIIMLLGGASLADADSYWYFDVKGQLIKVEHVSN
jgi:hypothetical protein